ncbi:hypothetical protein VP01_2728g2 [Puccinia sorghi]|uniref:Uncharacterized protein n=1 Tax=Puccinia sorghi TaxID=27349 RepID=A0A0L6V395_9BASI|nr:hypothetical protein VP01_2728g2 [Puccinia sorghi]
MILHTPSSDESSICSRDLLQTSGRSHRGTSSVCYLHNANAPKFTLVPDISYHGVLSMSVAEHNFKARNFSEMEAEKSPYLVKCHLHCTHGLVNASDPIWVIWSIAHSVVSPDLCHELYCHAGHNCPPYTNDQASI